jgi:surfactin synthase thioesterase subunit
MGVGQLPRWIRTFHPRADPVARLVCFPHAGGSASAYRPLSHALPPEIELLAVQYPGRQERRAEPAATDITVLARASAHALRHVSDRPVALFGHSMGALAAFETARLLPGADQLPLRLFASAARPPSRDWQVKDIDACADEEVVADLERLGGVPAELLADEEIRQEVLRVLRADHRMMLAYRHRPGAVLPAPITVLLGAGDPKNSEDHTGDWAGHTSAGLDVEVFPGGHFYLNDHVRAVAALLTRRIRHDLSAPAGLLTEEESPWRLPLPI